MFDGHCGACWFFGVALCGRGSFLFTVSSVDAHGFVSAWFGFALEPWGLLSSQSTATSLWDCSASAIRRVSAGSLRARILLPGLHERRRRPVRRLPDLLFVIMCTARLARRGKKSAEYRVGATKHTSGRTDNARGFARGAPCPGPPNHPANAPSHQQPAPGRENSRTCAGAPSGPEGPRTGG